jgi:hypothetical protein
VYATKGDLLEVGRGVRALNAKILLLFSYLEIDLTAAEFFYFFKRSEPRGLRAPKLFYAAYTPPKEICWKLGGAIKHI